MHQISFYLRKLALHGTFYEVPEELLFHRDHRSRSVYSFNRRSYPAWLDPKLGGRISFPTWRLSREYSLCVARAPIPWAERFRCWYHILRWLHWNKNSALEDLAFACGLTNLIGKFSPKERNT